MDSREVLTRAAEPPDIVLRYADHEDGLVDVFLPASLGRPGSPRPLLVLLHGGFWRQEYDRVQIRPLVNALAQRGCVVAVPEYRRVGGSGGWPQTGDDVEAALVATPALLAEVAPSWVDAGAAVMLWGHSAGGHLALWAGLRAGPRRVASIVTLAPVSDLAYAARAGMGDNAVQALLGGDPDDVPARYADADTASLLPGAVPVTIIQGTADKQVTVDMNRRLAARHSEIDYVELDGVEHFALIDPLSEAFRTTVVAHLGC
ncbi:MAG: alpha/beta hydrolase family protein [Nocardioidaceae bacterium]